jgi:hypothetical protein
VRWNHNGRVLANRSAPSLGRIVVCPIERRDHLNEQDKDRDAEQTGNHGKKECNEAEHINSLPMSRR